MMFLTASAAVLAGFALLLVLLGAARKHGRLSLEACRKSAHIVMGLVCLAFPLFVKTPLQAILLGSMFTTLLLVLRRRPSLLGAGGNLFAASRCNSDGEFYFVAGIVVCLLIARQDAFAYGASVLLLTFSDPAAGAIGARKGRLFCWGNGKTLEGSIAFLIAGMVSLFGWRLMTGNLLPFATLFSVCLLACVAEGLARRGSDNLWIPVAALVAMQIPHWAPVLQAPAPAVIAASGVLAGFAREGRRSYRPI